MKVETGYGSSLKMAENAGLTKVVFEGLQVKNQTIVERFRKGGCKEAALMGDAAVATWQCTRPLDLTGGGHGEHNGRLQLSLRPEEEPMLAWALMDHDAMVELGLRLAFIDHYGTGLELVFTPRRQEGLDLDAESYCDFLAAQLDLKEGQWQGRHLAWASFVPRREDVLYMDERLWDDEAEVCLSFGEPRAADYVRPKGVDDLRLPPLLRLVVESAAPGYREGALMTALTLLGARLPLRMTYRGTEVHTPSLQTVIVGDQSIGKGYYSRLAEVLMGDLREQDRRAYAIRRKNKQLRQDKRDRLADKGAQLLEEPPVREVAENTSLKVFLENMDRLGGRHMWGFYEELTSITRRKGAGTFSLTEDLERKAFDNGIHSQDYAAADSYSGAPRIYYNYAATGTPGAVLEHYRDVENGSASRVCFVLLDRLECSRGSERVLSEDDLACVGREVQALDALADDAQESWRVRDGRYMMTADFENDVALGWRRLTEDEAVASADEAALNFLNRSAVIGFRAGCICHALWRFREDAEVLEAVRGVVEYVAELTYRNQLRIFRKLYNRQHVSFESCTHQSLLGMMPNLFTRPDLNDLMKDMHYTRTASHQLSEWRHNGLVVECPKGQNQKYKKTRKGLRY